MSCNNCNSLEVLCDRIETLYDTFCTRVKACLGIRTTGSSSLVLNQQGEWVPVGSTIELQTDGVDNGNQNLLNLKAGENVNLTDDGNGGITIDVTAPVTIDLEVDGTPNTDQTLLNLIGGTGITLTDDGVGGVTIDASNSAPIYPDTEIVFGDGATEGGVSNSNLTFDGVSVLTIDGNPIDLGAANAPGVWTNDGSGVVSYTDLDNYTFTGTVTFLNDYPLGSGGTPTLPNQLVDKAYVDTLAAGIIPTGTVIAATTASLPANTAGGGFTTLTANANGVFPAQDGVTLVNGDAILVKDEVATENNGKYEVTDVGSGGTPWILTRLTNYDTPAEIVQGTAVPIISGTQNGNTVWWLVSDSVATLGTDPIVFNQLYTGITGIVTIAQGGTNSGTALNNDRVMISDSGAIVEAPTITANRALVSDANGIPTHSTTTDTEIGYVSGATSNIQAQIDAIGTPDDFLLVSVLRLNYNY